MDSILRSKDEGRHQIRFCITPIADCKIIPQFDVLTTVKTSSEGIVDVSEHLYYTPILALPDSFSCEDKKLLTGAFTELLVEKLLSSFKSLAPFLNTEYLYAGRASSGISGVPNGNAYYDYAIKYHTTTNMTTDKIHELGLKEVVRILVEMEKVKQQVGFEGELKDVLKVIRTNKELMPYSNPQEVIDNYNAIYDKMKPQLTKLFAKKPKTDFIVKQTTKFSEAAASVRYNPEAKDETRPYVFYVPIPDATVYNIFYSEALFLHEATPGHHYQSSMTQESEDLPDFRKNLWYSGYGEGSALYTESLGKELGLYIDPYQYFGMLSTEMHRAIRLVIDTGIHAKGWSREKAIQYSLDNEGKPVASTSSEIERYMALPDQALSYKIGQLKIRELRTRA